jgi:hypothetical protein
VKSYSETTVFTNRDKAILGAAIQIVQAFPDHEPDKDPWRCHEVARAVVRLMPATLGLVVVDGQFAGAQHSWLAYRDDGRTRILDVYCVGRLPMVQLVDPSWCRELGYRPAHLPRDDVRSYVVSFLADSAEKALGKRTRIPLTVV